MSIPRYDFYQSPTHVIAAVYLKGLKAEDVEVQFEVDSVTIKTTEAFTIPLAHPIDPSTSTFRVLSTKIELKLTKTTPEQWSTLVSSGPLANPESGPSNLGGIGIAGPSRIAGGPAKVDQGVKTARARKNWDNIKDEEEDQDQESKDPLFSSIYAGADEDTKRAMIKSFTESGGTTLSTDWSAIGDKATPVRPPEGMEAKKY